MSVTISVNITKDELGPTVKRVLDKIGPRNRTGLNKVAGRASLNALKRYHAKFDSGGGWRAKGGGGSKFGADIVRGWGMARVTSDEVVMTNTAPHLSHKITGGTISAKRAKYLTIPLVPEAKDRFAETYERVTGKRLFRPKGTDVLAEKDPSSPTGIRPIYALKKSVYQRPVRGAMPRPEVYVTPFVESIRSQLREALS